MRRTFAILLAAGVLLSYDSWVLLFLSPYPFPLTGYVSELAAADQPYSWLFRSGDALAGSLMVLIAILGVRGWRPRFGRAAMPLAVAIGVAGLATIGDSIAALPCTQTFDPVCYAEYTANPLRPDFLLHAIAYSIVAIGAMASLVIAVIALRRRGSLGTAYGRGVLAVLGVLIVANIGSVIIEMTWRAGQGYIHALGVLVLAAWAAHLGFIAVMDRGAAVDRGAVDRGADDRGAEADRGAAVDRGSADA